MKESEYLNIENKDSEKPFDIIFVKDLTFAFVSGICLFIALFSVIGWFRSMLCALALLYHNLIIVDWR